MKDYSKEIFPLNHFVLWCKGWYKPVDSLEPIEVTLSRVLKLDGYSLIRDLKDVLIIVLNELESYNEWLSKNNRYPLKLATIYYEASQYEVRKAFQGKKCTAEEAVIYAIKNFFMEKCSNDIVLKKPFYSKELRKQGLEFHQNLRKSYQGMTYTEQNRIAKKIFKNK